MNIKQYLQGIPPQKKKKAALIALTVLLLSGVAIALLCTVGRPIVDLFLKPQVLRHWVESHGPWGRVVFVLMMTFQVVFAIIPGEPLEIAAGYAFGTWWGLLWCTAGIVLGSTLVFWLTRRFGIKLVERFVPIEKINSLGFVKNSKKLNFLVFLLFFLPGVPKDVVTYFVGLTPMKASVFLLLTSVARIPSIITSTLGGDALGTSNYLMALWVFIGTGVLSLIGLAIYNFAIKKQENS